jgi:hypothetical protein
METKTAFLDLYTKVDAKVGETPEVAPAPTTNEVPF